MARTKGVGFCNVRSFTIERFGADGWARLLAAMAPDDREVLASVIGVGWYDLALYARLIRRLDGMHGQSDLGLVAELGRYEAEQDLTTIHRLFMRLANPAFVIEKAAEYWRRFHDTGEFHVTRDGPTRLHGTLDGWGVVDSALCREVAAYISRLLELVGAKDVRIQHPRCRAHGEEVCAFVMNWKA